MENEPLLPYSSPCSSSEIQDMQISPKPSLPDEEKKQTWYRSLSPASTFLRRSKTAPAMANIYEIPDSLEREQPQFGKQRVRWKGFVVLIMYLALGVVIFSLSGDGLKGAETHPVVDALYFCILTLCTIGYSDITPDSTMTKLFSVMFVLVGFGFISILLSGMISYMLDLQHVVDVRKGRMMSGMKVGMALGVVVICIGVGVAVMHFVEKLEWLDSLYLSVMCVTTVGYGGGRAFNSLGGRIFASIWLLVSTLAFVRALLFLAEARVERRRRRMEKCVLEQDMSVEQFVAADMDSNGFVNKTEYLIYKLKEMGRMSEQEISTISKQFERLDVGNRGKISLVDLMQH